MKHFPPKSADTLLELIVRRHQNRSTLLTSNRPIEDWGRLLGDVPAATAIFGPLPPAGRNHSDYRAQLPLT